MIIASPWSRGGFVCSEVFDHTSSLQFLEKFLEKKTGKRIIEENISAWRRTVCGNLTSAFRPYQGETIQKPPFLEKEAFVKGIHNAKFAADPMGFRKLQDEEIKLVNREGNRSGLLPAQEMGIRNACPLPYELYGHGSISEDRRTFQVALSAGQRLFGAASSGAPFYVYMHNLKDAGTNVHRDYAVKPGDQLLDTWALDSFAQESYELRLYGPNGFYRAFRGNADDPLLDIRCGYALSSAGKPTGNLEVEIRNREAVTYTLTLADESYGSSAKTVTLKPNARERIIVELTKQYGWYDVSLQVQGKPDFSQQFAGHVETMQASKTDPLMGGLV
jgi:phospholipase C